MMFISVYSLALLILMFDHYIMIFISFINAYACITNVVNV